VEQVSCLQLYEASSSPHLASSLLHSSLSSFHLLFSLLHLSSFSYQKKTDIPIPPNLNKEANANQYFRKEVDESMKEFWMGLEIIE